MFLLSQKPRINTLKEISNFSKKNEFFKKTKFNQENMFFVNEYEDKGPIGVKLGIDYLVDDSIKVAKYVIESGFKPILFG